MSSALTRDVAAISSRAQVRLFTGVAVAALAMAVVARLRLDLSAPLWLDETWTAAFASEPTFAALTEQVRNDANAPVYYYAAWAWAQLFGLSNPALHLPNMAVSLLTPAAAWFGLRRSHPTLALAWAVLLATWLPGIYQADEARCYPLLYGSAVLSTLAHIRLLAAPSLRRATIWSACAAFMTLVHYYAGMLALCQGLTLLALHRGRALRLWPGALPFVPAFAWIAWHAPRLAEFARPGVAWYDLLTPAELPLPVMFALGGPVASVFVVAAMSVRALSPPSRERAVPKAGAGHPGHPGEAALWWACGAALAAAALCLAVAMVRPTFTYRYLTPFVPGLSLFVAVWVVRFDRVPGLAATALVGGALGSVTLIAAQGSPVPRAYNYEVASAWLAETKPTRLVFFWDQPLTAVETRSQLDVIGGFFLRRSGLPVAVTPLYRTADDMNGPALAAAGQDAAVLWLYDVQLHHTSATAHPPRLESLDPGLECRGFGAANIGVLACRRRPAP